MLLKQTGWVPPGTFDILGPYFQRLVSPQFKIHAKNVNSVCIYTAPTWKGDLNFSKWGPKGDLILSEMGTKRGPSAAEKGTKRGLNGDLKAYIWLTGCSKCTKPLTSWRVYHIFALPLTNLWYVCSLCFQSWPPDSVTCTVTLPWIARVALVKFHKPLSVTDRQTSGICLC